MKKIAVKGLSMALVLAVFATAVFALGGGTTSADFLKIGVGARPSAMGEAYAAVGGDSNAAFWNPAGISSVDRVDITMMHLSWYMNTGYEYLAFVMPVDNLTNIGFSANYFWIPPFDSTVDNPFTTADGLTAASFDLAGTFTVSRILGNLYTSDFTIGNIAMGANFTYVARKLLDEMLPGSFMLDLGLMANITERVKFGLVVSNIGPASGDDPSPLGARAGLSADFSFTKDAGLLLSADIDRPLDLTNPDYSKWFFNIGGEINLFNYVYGRFGYKAGREDESFTVGGGIAWPGFGSIDYAFVPHSELGDTHRFSLTAKFGDVVQRPLVGGPQPPRNVQAISGDKVVSIGWDPNPEANIIGYNIYFKKQDDKTYEKLNKEPIMEESKFKAVLNNDITYNFAVTAINNRKLESIYSQILSATPQKYVAKKPAVVRGISASVKAGSIIIEWNESREDFVAGYNLYYKKDGDDKYKRLNRAILKEPKATLAGLQARVRYTFIITAVAKDGLEGDYSEPVAARIDEEKYY